MKTCLVGKALQALERGSRKYTGGALQPANVIMVLCGDRNLTEELGKQAAVSAQPVQETSAYSNSWIVKSSMFAESGDLLFYKGARGEILSLSMGNNVTDRGMQRHSAASPHDTFSRYLRTLPNVVGLF